MEYPETTELTVLSLKNTGCHKRVYKSEEFEAFWRRTSIGHGIERVQNSIVAAKFSHSSDVISWIWGTILIICFVSGCKPWMTTINRRN